MLSLGNTRPEAGELVEWLNVIGTLGVDLVHLAPLIDERGGLKCLLYQLSLLILVKFSSSLC